jgi:hypothetical protein
VITGRINPSGKLSETFPKRLQDTPTFPEFPAVNRRAIYGEGVFIGYRYYDKKDIEPLFPFDFGLSYTTFEYTGIKSRLPVNQRYRRSDDRSRCKKYSNFRTRRSFNCIFTSRIPRSGVRKKN